MLFAFNSKLKAICSSLVAMTAIGAGILILASCDSESGGSGSFSSYSYSGTLTGGSTGTFRYTVTDSYGNANGSAEIIGRTITLRGSVTNSLVNLQFQDDSQYTGAINGSESSGAMTGTWYLRGSKNYDGTATASLTSNESGSGSCTSLIGTWTSSDGYHKWEITASTIVITTKSTTTPGALQITYTDYKDSGTSITYTITRIAMTGSGGSDYDTAVGADDPRRGPFTEQYKVDSCKLTIGGKTYSH